MATQKILLRSVDELNLGYTPTYQPIWPLVMAGAQTSQYASEVGQVTYKKLEAVGDIRAKHVSPKTTEMALIAAGESSKVYKKYFLGNRFVTSGFQDQSGVDDVLREVLDEQNKQMDDLLLLGEGTSAVDAINNGLYWSADPNYTLESSATIASSERLYDLHSKIMVTAAKANQIAGQKQIIFYGNVKPYLNSLFPTSAASFRARLAESLPGYDVIELPDAVTPSSANGWIVVNKSQIKVNYSAVPQLSGRGFNEEEQYYWFNFLMGSVMVDVKVANGIIRQPSTLA